MGQVRDDRVGCIGADHRLLIQRIHDGDTLSGVPAGAVFVELRFDPGFAGMLRSSWGGKRGEDFLHCVVIQPRAENTFQWRVALGEETAVQLLVWVICHARSRLNPVGMLKGTSYSSVAWMLRNVSGIVRAVAAMLRRSFSSVFAVPKDISAVRRMVSLCKYATGIPRRGATAAANALMVLGWPTTTRMVPCALRL
ncbi:hypothetical protein GCM10027417_03380 [Glutamicibacter endophyticus]